MRLSRWKKSAPWCGDTMSWRQRLILLALWPLCQLSNLIAAIWMLTAIIPGSSRAWTLAISYDQLANAAFGGNEDETISSMAAKKAKHGVWWAKWLCRALDAVDPGHSQRAIEKDRGEIVTN
jgi:hypothetical protein